MVTLLMCPLRTFFILFSDFLSTERYVMIPEGSRQWPLFSVFSLVAHANQLPILQSYVEILRPLVCYLYILEAPIHESTV